MKIVVLDAEAIGYDLDWEGLHAIGPTVIYDKTKPEQVAERIDGFDIVVLNKVKLDASNLSGTDSLKLICEAATGYDNIDLEYCKKRGIAVSNVCGYSTPSVTQLTLSMALSLATHLREFDDHVKSGKYTRGGKQNQLEPVFHELCGKTWGIVGLGNIGKQVAKAAEAIGCRVIGYKRTPDDAYSCVDLDTLCKTSDIISLHIPLSEETKNCIDRKRIAMMKENAILINVARGAVVDEEALAEAVLGGCIAGIGVDVYSTEPFPEEHPYTRLLGLDNVILTPHVAWGAYEARVRCLGEIVENIRAFLIGENRNRVEL